MAEVTQHGLESSEVIERIFTDCLAPTTVLDLTYGLGVFWKWEYGRVGVSLHTNDLYTEAEGRHDFMNYPSASYDTVVFDPPFTAQGPNKKEDERHNDRYGATRDLPGAPQNIGEVHDLLRGGIHTACRTARRYVVVKTQDVVESGKLHGSVNVALNQIVACGFNVFLQIRFFGPRRPQPAGRRVTGLGGQPSVFIVAEKKEE